MTFPFKLLYLYFLVFLTLIEIRSRRYSLGILYDREDDQFISESVVRLDGLTVWTVQNAYEGGYSLKVIQFSCCGCFFSKIEADVSNIGMMDSFVSLMDITLACLMA